MTRFLSLPMRVWIRGLLSAALSGAATTVSVMVADPLQFNLDQWPRLLKVSALNAALSVALYLRQSPLPPCQE